MATGNQVGLIGLGAVGTGLALLLAENGYNLVVADARPVSAFDALLKEGGGRLQWASADELCKRCNVVLTSLPSVAIIDKVAHAHIFPHFKGTWIDTSTTDEDRVKQLGPIAKAKGIDLLESPLTGGSTWCEAAT